MKIIARCLRIFHESKDHSGGTLKGKRKERLKGHGDDVLNGARYYPCRVLEVSSVST